MRPMTILAAVALLSVAAAPSGAETALETLTIKTASGDHTFKVEVMRSGPEMEKGLMFRRTMAADRGMLFDFKTPKPVMMWMKNTYLPLDMVFIDATGTVINIANAVPLSEEIIPSGGPTLGVLEVNAGTATKIGLKAGDHVDASIFPR